MVLLLRLSSNEVNEFDKVNNPEPEMEISKLEYPRKATLIDDDKLIIFRKANTLNVTPEMTLVTINGFITFVNSFTITPRRSSRYPVVRISALVYADDIAMTCDTIDQAENVFLLLEMNASKVGFKINLEKAKIQHAGHISQPRPDTTITGYTL